MSERSQPDPVMDLGGTARSRYVVGIRISVEVALVAIMAWAVHTSAGFPQLARVFPLTATLAALALTVANLALDATAVATRAATRRKARRAGDGTADVESDAHADAEFRRAAYYMIWLIGLIAVMRVIGALIGGVVFLAVFLRVEAKWRWWQVLIGAAVTFGLLYELHTALSLQLPTGLVELID